MTQALRWSLIPAAVALLAAALPACNSDTKPHGQAEPSTSATQAAAQASAGPPRFLPGVKHRFKPVPMASAIPVAAANVDDSVNPEKLPPYTGPVGAIEGVVTFKGEVPRPVQLALSDACKGAAATYGTTYRQGPERTAADVLVAVTGYHAYVPAKEQAVRVEMNNCADDRRTVALTYGQRLEIANADASNSYIPMLIGDDAPAHMVAVPHGDPVKLYPSRVGHYQLADEMNRPWMKADVYVLKFATYAITGMDGHFRIEGIPVGSVNLTADVPWIAPALDQTVKVTVEEGKTARVNFTLEVGKPAAPAASSSAAPKVPEVR